MELGAKVEASKEIDGYTFDKEVKTATGSKYYHKKVETKKEPVATPDTGDHTDFIF